MASRYKTLIGYFYIDLTSPALTSVVLSLWRVPYRRKILNFFTLLLLPVVLLFLLPKLSPNTGDAVDDDGRGEGARANNEHKVHQCKAYGCRKKWKICQTGAHGTESYAICQKCPGHPAGGPDGFEEYEDLTS
jgi:hypothetical protein